MSLPFDLEVGELAVAVTAGDARVLVAMQGTADNQTEAALGQLLGRVHAEAQQLGAAAVTIDIRALEFMNSSCFKAFITWIVAVRRLAAEQRYDIVFLSSAAMHWQKRSLHALGYFGGELVRVEVE